MLDKTEYSRLLIKRTNTTGSVPTIPPVSADTLSQFIPTDIMVGEFFLNTVDDSLWIRTETGIIPVSLGGGAITGATGNFEIVSGQTWTDLYSGNCDAGFTLIDWDRGNVQEIVLTASTEFYLANGQPGATYVIMVKQTSTTTPYTITWDFEQVLFEGGVIPVMSTSTDSYDVYTLVYNGIKYFCSYVQNFQS